MAAEGAAAWAAATVSSAGNKLGSVDRALFGQSGVDPSSDAQRVVVLAASGLVGAAALASVRMNARPAATAASAKKVKSASGIDFDALNDVDITESCTMPGTETLASIKSDDVPTPLMVGSGPHAVFWQAHHAEVATFQEYWSSLITELASQADEEAEEEAAVPVSPNFIRAPSFLEDGGAGMSRHSTADHSEKLEVAAGRHPLLCSDEVLEELSQLLAALTMEEVRAVRWFLSAKCTYRLDEGDAISRLKGLAKTVDSFLHRSRYDSTNAAADASSASAAAGVSWMAGAQATTIDRLLVQVHLVSVLVEVHCLRAARDALEQRSNVIAAVDMRETVAEVPKFARRRGPLFERLVSTVPSVAAPIEALEGSLNASSAAVASAARRCNWRNSGLLARYLCTSIGRRVTGTAATLALTVGTSRIAMAGQSLRSVIECTCVEFARTETTMRWAVGKRLLKLSLFETARLGISHAATKLTTSVIALVTGQSRIQTKERLYAALARTPLAFYDTLEEGELDEIVFYVNDLEGVDVHLQTYAVQLVESAIGCYVAVNATLGSGMRGLLQVATAVVLIKGLESSLRATARAFATVETDAEELENSLAEGNDRRRCLLRGLEVLEHVRALRPLGGDRRLMDAWSGFVSESMREEGSAPAASPVRHAVRTHALSIASFCHGAANFCAFGLPVAVGAILSRFHHDGSSVSTVVDTIAAIVSLADVIADSKRLWCLWKLNAHKAFMLDRLLRTDAWETADTKATVSEQGAMITPTPTRKLKSAALHDVVFAYPSRPDRVVLSHYSSSAAIPLGGGRLVAIVGPSGCGKSTILSLLLRLYEPNTGYVKITFDDGTKEALHNIPHGTVREQLFGYVPQQAEIFHGSVAQNVSLEPTVSITDHTVLNRVRKSLEGAGCESLLKLPEGMHTIIGGPSSIQLSGGQAQRLAVARALYRRPQVLILDEPTASLDPATRDALIGSLKSWAQKHGSAAVCVTHDEALMDAADTVVEMTCGGDLPELQDESSSPGSTGIFVEHRAEL